MSISYCLLIKSLTQSILSSSSLPRLSDLIESLTQDFFSQLGLVKSIEARVLVENSCILILKNAVQSITSLNDQFTYLGKFSFLGFGTSFDEGILTLLLPPL